MAEIFRLPIRMDCQGLDLVNPIDRQPKGSFPYLFNVRVVQEGRLDGRPGYTPHLTLGTGDIPNSVRRLNDPSKRSSPTGFAYVGGGGTKLYFGSSLATYGVIDGGYFGAPLSIIPFRPDQAVEDWAYVYGPGKQSKVSSGGVLRQIGVVPPQRAPQTEYGRPAWVMVNKAGDGTLWTASGSATGASTATKLNGAADTLVNILYNTGVVGWACIHPGIAETGCSSARMVVTLHSGQPNAETVVVREIHRAIPNTTIASIQYDVGSTGACSLKLSDNHKGLARNSLLELGSEIVRVLEAVPSPDGTQYSVRCVTTGTHVAGESVTGLLSWYVYTVLPHLPSESIYSRYVDVAQGSAGVGIVSFTGNVDAGLANGRPIDTANDYLHLSLLITDVSQVNDLKILLSLDATPNVSSADPGNSLIFTIPGSQLASQGAAAGQWVELIVPISSATRTGADLTLTLSNISAVSLELGSATANDWGFDNLYLFGTYGPVVQPNSPIGIQYQSRYRDTTTGAKSVPGPLTRYELFPLRESVIITPDPSTQPGVDVIDNYRIGGTISNPLYVGSSDNLADVPQTVDTQADDTVLGTNQAPDPTALQPWPLLDRPWQGTCEVSGTSIRWKSGTKFNTALIGNTAVLIDGQAYLLYGSPRSDSFLEITQDAGQRGEVWFQIASPTLAGQPLPFVFGPLEGPFVPVLFGLGDTLNGGHLYFTNFNDPDSVSDANTLEIANVGNDLVSGAVWGGMAFAGNREDVFSIRYSYLTTIGASSNQSFQWDRVRTPSGFWSRWAVCYCPLGVAYLGRDGIYICTDSGGVNITDERLYPLFPHKGQPAKPSNLGSNIILPVDMTLVERLRLSYCDERLVFTYVDTGGNWNTLEYEIYAKRWILHNFSDAISSFYMAEGSADSPKDMEILALDIQNKRVVRMGGDTDAGAPITSIALTPSLDGGDHRTQKLYVDSMTKAGGTGAIQLAAAFDDAQSFSPILTINPTGAIETFLQNISSLSELTLYRNIAAKFSWTGGPSGPQLYAWEPSGYTQPYLINRLVTQYSQFSFPGWKHFRRLLPALISTAPVMITLRTQDGRTFGPYTIPSTFGQYRIFPQMLDHGIKDLAFAVEIDGGGSKLAIFPDDFTAELKEWVEETYVKIAIFKA